MRKKKRAAIPSFQRLSGKPARSEIRTIPTVHRVAHLQAETADKEARTVDLDFYTGAPVLRVPFFDDPFELEFEVSDKAARLGRLNAGAPLVDSHATRGVSNILGVVERAWIADGTAKARVRFSRRAEVEPIWQDVLDGVIRNVSMGVQIHELEEVTSEGAELERFRATDWEPEELSLVPVGADADAQVLAADENKRPCKIIHRAEASADAQQGGAMKIKVRLLATGEVVEIDETKFDEKLHARVEDPAPAPAPEGDPDPTPRNPQTARLVDEAIARDQDHSKEIQRIASHYGLDRVWSQRHVQLGTSAEQALIEAADERAKRSPKLLNDIGFGEDRDSVGWRSEQMASALAARATRKEAPEEARQYAMSSFVEIAHETLSWQGRHRGLDPRRHASEIVKLALHSTSDFPLLLGNVLNKILLPAYESAMPTYRALASRRSFNDFRPHRFARSGDFPAPLEVNEHGEFTYGTMGENEELVSLATFGRIIGFTRQALVNDDLGALQDLASKAARRVADFENAHFFTQLIVAGSGLGPDLSDGDTVYHANHANITGAGALDVTRLGEARSLMKKQTSLDGIKLNIRGAILLVSPDSETLADQLVAPLQPAQASNVNPFAGRLTPLADANLTGTRFYVMADPADFPNYVYGSLGSQSGPRTEVRAGFEVDGVEFKLALDFAVGAIDFRGGVTGAGA